MLRTIFSAAVRKDDTLAANHAEARGDDPFGAPARLAATPSAPQRLQQIQQRLQFTLRIPFVHGQYFQARSRRQPESHRRKGAIDSHQGRKSSPCTDSQAITLVSTGRIEPLYAGVQIGNHQEICGWCWCHGLTRSRKQHQPGLTDCSQTSKTPERRPRVMNQSRTFQ